MSFQPSIQRLTHTGLFVSDVEKSKAFYRDMLGLTVTDDDKSAQLVFLSADPEDEHHMIVLLPGRNAPAGVQVLQQVSFRCSTLADVIAFWRRFTENGVKIIYTSTHGNAISCYFQDPDGNTLEVYWATGLKARQGFLLSLDFNKSEAELMADVKTMVDKYGATGYLDMDMLQQQMEH